MAGAFASAIAALVGTTFAIVALVGAGVSLVSAVVHVRHAARFRRRHVPRMKAATKR